MKYLFHGLGKVVGCEHKVTVDENVKLIAQRLRRIPFAMLGFFFIIDWFTDPPTLLFGKLKKK